jgi:hypothetical protein
MESLMSFLVMPISQEPTIHTMRAPSILRVIATPWFMRFENIALSMKYLLEMIYQRKAGFSAFDCLFSADSFFMLSPIADSG